MNKDPDRPGTENAASTQWEALSILVNAGKTAWRLIL